VSIFSSDPEIVTIAAYGLRIYSLGFIIFGAQTACQQTFLALGEAKISMMVAIIRKIVLLIPLAIILPRLGLGTDGLFIAEPISDTLSVCTVCIAFALNFEKILARSGNKK
jgi:Na+-driven multidrug efflux pump